ncbi:MAG TPA: endonuclease III [archaeon]|nr:endonuclease III [archaeon]
MQAEKIISTLRKEYPNTKYYLDFSNPMELVVAAILSAQCRDVVVNATTKNLFKKYKTAKEYANANLENDIKSITFFKNKAKNIKEAFRIISEKHGGKVPDTMNELMELPGIGRKTANAILINAFNKVEGVIVDTHVIRLAYRFGWTTQKNPEKIERDLMAIIPKKDWKILPHLMKDHGRAVCVAVPKCSICVIKSMCPKQGVGRNYI